MACAVDPSSPLLMWLGMPVIGISVPARDVVRGGSGRRHSAVVPTSTTRVPAASTQRFPDVLLPPPSSNHSVEAVSNTPHDGVCQHLYRRCRHRRRPCVWYVANVLGLSGGWRLRDLPASGEALLPILLGPCLALSSTLMGPRQRARTTAWQTCQCFGGLLMCVLWELSPYARHPAQLCGGYHVAWLLTCTYPSGWLHFPLLLV